MAVHGPSLALASAALFGISPPLSKLVMGEMSAPILAGLLYLGSGFGLQIFNTLKKKSATRELKALPRGKRRKLLGAIVSGGILAPLCLVYGIQVGSAFEVSVLLNMEPVATTLLAWLVFREHVPMRVWVGKIPLLVGGVLITIAPYVEGRGISLAGLSVLLACVLWGLDNNLTRDVEEISPSILAGVKGWTAGAFNLTLGVLLSAGSANALSVIFCLGLGALCYGLSLVLFVEALRTLGSARTSTYFAIGPFFGMLFSMLLLGERPDSLQWSAAGLMALGIWILYRENHEHVHVHDAMSHRHRHVHDAHHQHPHDGAEGPEPHVHFHFHEPLTHSHAHWPDIHHRHPHR